MIHDLAIFWIVWYPSIFLQILIATPSMRRRIGSRKATKLILIPGALLIYLLNEKLKKGISRYPETESKEKVIDTILYNRFHYDPATDTWYINP